MTTDRIADLLTRIRNAQLAGHPTTMVGASREKERILKVLADEGYISRYEAVTDENDKPAIKIYLRYTKYGTPVVREISRISKPGKRVYVAKDSIPHHKGGLGVMLVSTSQGVLTDREARKIGVGGELICSIF